MIRASPRVILNRFFRTLHPGSQMQVRNAAHREQLREWAENYPPTFAHRHALVSAEIARLEGRAFEAMQLYEQAIQSAHENHFVQYEALAHEVAAHFYVARGFETIAHTYLRNARNCYDRWGAHGKVKQLDEHYPHLHEERSPTAGPASNPGLPSSAPQLARPRQLTHLGRSTAQHLAPGGRNFERNGCLPGLNTESLRTRFRTCLHLGSQS